MYVQKQIKLLFSEKPKSNNLVCYFIFQTTTAFVPLSHKEVIYDYYTTVMIAGWFTRRAFQTGFNLKLRGCGGETKAQNGRGDH